MDNRFETCDHIFGIPRFLFILLPILLAFTGCGKGNSEPTPITKDPPTAKIATAKFDIRHLNPKKYEHLDEMGIVKGLLELDYDGELKKEVAKHGGTDALVAELKKHAAKNRLRFANLFLFHDALKEMGAPEKTIAAVVILLRKHDDFLELNSDDLISILPTVAKLHQALNGIGAPPEDLAKTLLEYLDEKPEDRAEKEAEIMGGVKRYITVRDLLLKAGMSKTGAEKGLAALAFPHASDKSEATFERDAEVYSELNPEGIGNLVSDCAKIIDEMKGVDVPEELMVEGIVLYLAAPASERDQALKAITKITKTFKAERERSGRIGAGLKAFNAAMSSDKGDTTNAEDKKGEEIIQNDQFRVKAKKILVGITAVNIEREAFGLGDVWPRTKANLDDDSDDVSGKLFADAGEYFGELMDLENFGAEDWFPYIKKMSISDWYTEPFSKGDKIDPKKVLWCVAMDVSDNLSDNAPILISANFNCAHLRRAWNGKDDADKQLAPNKGSTVPMKGVIVVRRNGTIFLLNTDTVTLRDVYGGPMAKGPKAYLTPSGIVEVKP